MSLGVVIVNYRTGHWLQTLIPQLCADSAVREIIVVDNSSDDPTDLKTFRDFPIRYLPLSQNMGFAAAVNAGMRVASTRYVAIINPDVHPHPQCLQNLYDTARSHRCPLVGPRFYWDPDHIFRLPPATGACLWWDWALRLAAAEPLDAEILQWFWIMRHERFWAQQAPFPEPFLSGALLLVDRLAFSDSLNAVLDERFFLYFEDSDLSLKALHLGQPPLCDPSAEAVHHWNQSPEPHTPKAALMAQAHSAFYGKYYNTPSPEAAVLRFIERMPRDDSSSGPAFSWPTRSASPWSAFSGCLAQEPIALGHITAPPTFNLPEATSLEPPLFLEFSLSPLFIPFAQADFVENTFPLPHTVWNSLPPGTYFCRARDPQRGTLKVWQWTKA